MKVVDNFEINELVRDGISPWTGAKEWLKKAAMDHGIQTHEYRPGALMERFVRAQAARMGFTLAPVRPDFPFYPPIEPHALDLLIDPDYQASVRQAHPWTLLDGAQLANIWTYAMRSPEGAMVEVGTYRGGGALHISNSHPERRMYVFDPFDGDQSFQSLDSVEDARFHPKQFNNTSVEYVRRIFPPERDVRLISGFFPDSARGLDLDRIAFCHLDIDVGEGTLAALNYLAERLVPEGSYVIVDDYGRTAQGILNAVDRFLETHPQFDVKPMFPGQGLIHFR